MSIDPSTFVATERSRVAAFAQAQASASNDISSRIGGFQSMLEVATQSEDQFANDLFSISSSYDPALLAQMTQTIAQTGSQIDASFQQLQSRIQQNNEIAKGVVSMIEQSQEDLAALQLTRGDVDARISAYADFLKTFRSYQEATAISTPATE